MFLRHEVAGITCPAVAIRPCAFLRIRFQEYQFLVPHLFIAAKQAGMHDKFPTPLRFERAFHVALDIVLHIDIQFPQPADVLAEMHQARKIQRKIFRHQQVHLQWRCHDVRKDRRQVSARPVTAQLAVKLHRRPIGKDIALDETDLGQRPGLLHRPTIFLFQQHFEIDAPQRFRRRQLDPLVIPDNRKIPRLVHGAYRACISSGINETTVLRSSSTC